MIPFDPVSDWHISLHFGGDQDFQRDTIQHLDRAIDVVNVSSTELDTAFPTSFDDFIAAINQLPGGYAEGDGSFGVVGSEGRWKICGTIYERTDSIQYAELLGSCPNDQLLELAKLLGANATNCVVQNMRGGYFQSLEQFLMNESS